MARIGLIRHGSTEWNVLGRAQGSSNVPLNEKGKEDAWKLAARLQNEKWDMIYSSDLVRARQTAEILVEKLTKIPIVLDDRLREIGGGLIEGTTEKERIEKWGRNWRKLDLGIENTPQVIARAHYFKNDVLEKLMDKNILIVSHGGLIKHLLQQLIPQMKVETPFGNTSITTLEKLDNQWKCDLYNCTLHLDN